MSGITVIIPTYNRASFLERALISVGKQSLACSEIIVIDDGSIDDTWGCVSRFSATTEIPVRYFYQANQGPAAARNRGIALARFSYLAFLDSDDHWERKKLQLQLAAMQDHPQRMISHTKERWFRRGKHLNQKKIHQPQDGDIFHHCLRLCAVGMSTVMVRRELFQEIGLFREELPCCEDYDLWVRVSSRHLFLLIDAPLTIKEGGRPDQVSFQYRVGMDRLRIQAIAALLQEGRLSQGQIRQALEELRRKCLIYGQGCLKHKQFQEGEGYLRLGLWAERLLDRDPAISLSIPAEAMPTI